MDARLPMQIAACSGRSEYGACLGAAAGAIVPLKKLLGTLAFFLTCKLVVEEALYDDICEYSVLGDDTGTAEDALT